MPEPTGSISVDNSTPSYGDLVTLTLNSYDNHGNAIDHWRVTWGDGGQDTGAGDPTLGVLATHTYSTGEGSTIIELDVIYTSPPGGTHFVTFTTVTLPQPNVTISATPADPTIGQTVTATLDSYDDGGFTVTGWILHWGDGNEIDQLGMGPPSLGTLGTHSYTADGTDTLQLELDTTELGRILVATFDVTVGEPPPPVITGCPTIELRVPADADPIIFDCMTADTDENIWGWTELIGWWEPPGIVRATLALGDSRGETPTKSDWAPRQITLKAQARLTDGGLNAALDQLTALTNMLVTPGRITVNDATPKYATVLLSDKPPQPQVIGESKLLEVQIPMIAHDVYRYRVADDIGVL